MVLLENLVAQSIWQHKSSTHRPVLLEVSYFTAQQQ